MNKSVSVIVPVYNAENYIARCIESVRSQTHTNWELILVNDGSVDDSPKIIDEFGKKDKRIRIFNQTNRGAAAARNVGLDNATGDFIFFLDADDYLPTDALEYLITEQIKNDSDIVIGDFEYRIDGETFAYSHTNIHNTQQFIHDFLASSWVVICGSLIKTTLFKDCQIRFPEGVVYSEDFSAILKILLASSSISNCHKICYHYNRDNESSVTHKNDPKKILNERDVYLQSLFYVKDRNLLALYEEPLVWKLLKIEQALVYTPEYFNTFRKNYPLKIKYISTCSFISRKMKIMMWLILKRYDLAAKFMLRLRKSI